MVTEILWCHAGQHPWQRDPALARAGRRPRSCPDHAPEAARKQASARAAYRTTGTRRSATREDVRDQASLDLKRNPPSLTLLEQRLDAVREAHAHEREVGPFPLRQALIDLAAACEIWAMQLPRPTISPQRTAA